MTLGFDVVSRLIRDGFGGPVDVRAAIGHGRSYGAWSTVIARSYPGIVDCGLWRDLSRDPNSRTCALLTDVGNDLMYGYLPETIAGWVETCLDRLGEVGASTVVTRLPLCRVERLSAGRYHATRFVFFANHRPVSWTEMLRRARELDERVVEAAIRRGAAVVEPRLEWYSFDPIHIRWLRRRTAWSSILSEWPGFRVPERPRSRPLPLLGRFPERYRLFGREASNRQPVFASDDATLSFY